MKKIIKLITATLIITLFSCDMVSFDYNNSVDDKAENYQGYETISDIDSITLNQITTDSTDITWSEVIGATKYHLIVGNNSSFSTIYYQNENIIINSISKSTIGLINEGDSYYKIRAFKDSWGEWSEVLSFTVDLSEPTNLNPASSELVTDTTPTLSWDEVSGATGYYLEINTAEDFSGTEIVSDDTLITNSYTLSISLDNNQNYYWRVKQKDGNGVWSDWSDIFVIKYYYVVGDYGPSGGYIFFVDSSNVFDGWRYLEAAPEDISGTKVWGTYDTLVSGADETGLGTGAQNTLDIIAGDSSTVNAAHACEEYSVTVDGTTYDDWFLPSIAELYFMYDNLHFNGLGGFVSSSYWSSSEIGEWHAWDQNFNNGDTGYIGLKDSNLYVRPVRAF